MSAFSTLGKGRYVANEWDVLAIPRLYRRDGTKMGVIYCHGAGELAASPLGSVNSKIAEAQLLSQIAAQYPMAMADLGTWEQGGTSDSNSWGNTNAQTRVGQLKTWLQSASGGGAKSGKVALIGISMGATTALNYARNNPTQVVGVIGIIPVIDLDDIRTNDLGGGPETGYTVVIGQNNSSATGTSLVISVINADALLQGDAIVVAVCTDGTSTTPTIADSKTNTWQTDQNVTGGTTNAHVRTTIFSCVLAAGKVLANGDTITITHGSVAARAAVAVGLRGNPSTSWKDTSNGASVSGATSATTTTATTTASVVLAVGVLGYENRGISVTQPSGWTFVVKEETSGGAAASNVGVCFAVQRFSGLQTVTYNPTFPSSDATVLCVNYKKANGYRPSIDSAWGVTYPTALPAGANPASNTSGYTGIPVRLWYANDDAIARATPATTFAGAIADGQAVDVGATGHSDTSIGSVPESDIITLLNTWAT